MNCKEMVEKVIHDLRYEAKNMVGQEEVQVPGELLFSREGVTVSIQDIPERRRLGIVRVVVYDTVIDFENRDAGLRFEVHERGLEIERAGAVIFWRDTHLTELLEAICREGLFRHPKG